MRRKVRKKPNPGRPLRRAARLSRGLRTGKNCRFIDEFTALILAARPLTMPGPEAYIDLTTRRPLRRDGASAKPLTVYGERASGHDLVAMTDARGFGGSGFCRRRSRKVPGCLTGESEERETWTAESLRAASSNGEGLVERLGFFRKRAAMEETSAVDVSGQHFGPLARLALRKRLKWDLVKRCDQPRSNLFNLRV